MQHSSYLCVCVCVMARKLKIEQESPQELKVLIRLTMKIIIRMWSHVVWEIGTNILEIMLPLYSWWKMESEESSRMLIPTRQIIQHLTPAYNLKKTHSNIVICINNIVIPGCNFMILISLDSVIRETIMKIILEIW